MIAPRTTRGKSHGVWRPKTRGSGCWKRAKIPGSAQRDVGLRSAQGRLVAYLDQDDEYDPRYLERLAGLGDQGDIFIFGYDVVYDDEPQRPVGRWQPELSQDRVFGWNVVTPLGIAHRREWIDKVGEFNELVWIEEDTIW